MLSGSTDFDLKAREIIRFALEKINIVAKGEPCATPVDPQRTKLVPSRRLGLLPQWIGVLCDLRSGLDLAVQPNTLRQDR